MATVIVPAHNESAVIADCLGSIVGQTDVEQVIVACNGCTDDTAEIVKSQFPAVCCLEIAKPSKVNALNVAEAKARELGSTFPIFYIDADTTLGPNAITRICRALETGSLLLAAPTPVDDVSNSSRPVKQYYRTWLELPYVKEGVIATCSYVITEQGRRRFDLFPNVINDDGYVRGQFRTHELANIRGAEIYIRAPKDVYSLIKIKTRARVGNMQLRDKGLCMIQERRPYGSAIMRRVFNGHLVSSMVYVGIASSIRVRAWLQKRSIDSYEWERDNSSRKRNV